MFSCRYSSVVTGRRPDSDPAVRDSPCKHRKTAIVSPSKEKNVTEESFIFLSFFHKSPFLPTQPLQSFPIIISISFVRTTKTNTIEYSKSLSPIFPFSICRLPKPTPAALHYHHHHSGPPVLHMPTMRTRQGGKREQKFDNFTNRVCAGEAAQRTRKKGKREEEGPSGLRTPAGNGPE